MLVSTSCSAVQNIRRHCQAEVEENPSSVFPSMCTPPPPPATRPRPANASERPGPILFCAHANPKPKTPALPRAHLEALAGRTGLACAMKTPAPSRHACFACSVQSAARASRFMFCSRPLCSAAGLYVLQPASMSCSRPLCSAPLQNLANQAPGPMASSGAQTGIATSPSMKWSMASTPTCLQHNR